MRRRSRAGWLRPSTSNSTSPKASLQILPELIRVDLLHQQKQGPVLMGQVAVDFEETSILVIHLVVELPQLERGLVAPEYTEALLDATSR